MSTKKPYHKYRRKDSGDCANHLHQEFNQKSPDLVWTSDFTYIKVAGKWYYLCIVMDLFSLKVITWNIYGKPNVDLVMTTFRKAYEKRNFPYGSCSILTQDLSILLLLSVSFWILTMSFSHFQKRDILSIMHAANVS